MHIDELVEEAGEEGYKKGYEEAKAEFQVIE